MGKETKATRIVLKKPVRQFKVGDRVTLHKFPTVYVIDTWGGSDAEDPFIGEHGTAHVEGRHSEMRVVFGSYLTHAD